VRIVDARFRDRTHAGQELAQRLAGYCGRSDVLVLGLPRGGVPVAYEVARALGAPLDVFMVRKLGVPFQPELAMGAIASGGARLNQEVIDALGLSQDDIERAAAEEELELARRERLYRGDRPFPRVHGRTVIVIDDGLATGSTMHAAVAAIRNLGAAPIVIAVPVAPPETVTRLADDVDEVVAVSTPEPFFAIGQHYEDFAQTSDDEVRELLAHAAGPELQAEVPP
jgi:putative phosphoribosyl transferase